MPPATYRNFHLPLPAEMLDELRLEAKRSNQPATESAREAISQWLQDRRRQATDRAIRAYADATGGTRDDLDPALEMASVDSLLQGTSPRRRK